MSSVVAVPGPQSTGSIVVVHRLSCSTACGIFLDQGPNPHLLHWQADSLPLSHQGSTSQIFNSLNLSLTLHLPSVFADAIVLNPIMGTVLGNFVSAAKPWRK